uniref:EamA domain-containing protein n=1 Tax=Psilocybe cubensis TaxID=181762 RepID=A0A8H8CGW3_PSICU
MFNVRTGNYFYMLHDIHALGKNSRPTAGSQRSSIMVANARNWRIYWSLWDLLLPAVPISVRRHRFDVSVANHDDSCWCHLFEGEIHYSTGGSWMAYEVVSLVGVVLIARPTFIFGDSAHSHEPNGTTPSERLLAVGVSLVGVLGATLAYISIRSIGKRAHTMHIMVYFALQCVVGSTIGMIVTKTPVVIPTQIEWLSLLFMIGVFGFAAQIFLTLGFQREAVGRGTLALYTQIIFASFLEYIVFHTTPSRLSIFGILLIMGSAIYIALTKKPNSPELNSISQPDDEELGRSLLSPNSDTP